MAKKVDEELADPYQRVISLTIPGCLASKGELDLEWTTIRGDWKSEPGNLGTLVWEGSIDLSGYANQSLTFFPESGFRQTTPYERVTGADGQGSLIASLITTVPLTYGELVNSFLFGTTPGLPNVIAGDPTSNVDDKGLDWSTVLYCDVRVGILDQNMPNDKGYIHPLQFGQTGSLDATAADKLYVYKLIYPFSANPAGLGTITGCSSGAERLGLIGQMAQEPTIEYMMRLKRSYELANQV